MSKVNLSVAEEISAYERKIDESIERWNHLRDFGCNDPFWPDGTNMNLVRNHVIYYLRKIHELAHSVHQISMFDEPIDFSDFMNDPRIPVEVNAYYMANDRKLNMPDGFNARLVRDLKIN